MQNLRDFVGHYPIDINQLVQTQETLSRTSELFDP